MEHGSLTQDGVTVTSNQQTTEQMREAAETPAAPVVETPVEPVKADAPVAEPSKKQARRDAVAKIQTQAAELGNKDQTISALNERLSEIDTLKRELAELKAGRTAAPPLTAPVPPPQKTEIDWSGFTEKPPTIDDFANEEDPYRALLRADAAYDRRKEAYGERQVQQRERAQHERTQAFTSRADSFAQRLTQVQQADPEFSASVEQLLQERGNPPMPPAVFEVLTEADCGPQLFRYLLENPSELKAVLALPNQKAQYGLMKKLEARVDAAVAGSAPPAPRKTSQAQPPINPVAGAHSVPKDGPPDPKTCTQEEFDAYWNRQERESHRRAT